MRVLAYGHGHFHLISIQGKIPLRLSPEVG